MSLLNYRSMISILLICVFVLGVMGVLAQEAEATLEATADQTVSESPDAGLALETDEVQPDTSSASGMFTGIWHLHSVVRWVMVILALAAIVKLVMGLLQKSAFDKTARLLTVFYTIGITVQWLIGLAFLFIYNNLTNITPRYQWEHLAVMTIAMAITHFIPRWKKAEDSIRYRNALIIVLTSLVLVGIGVAILPQGWRLAP
ncbi:hypothetical protein MASR2M15_22350 [Anaerolineales bacterium]